MKLVKNQRGSLNIYRRNIDLWFGIQKQIRLKQQKHFFFINPSIIYKKAGTLYFVDFFQNISGKGLKIVEKKFNGEVTMA